MKRFLLCLAITVCALASPVSARTLPAMKIITPAYTLLCGARMHGGSLRLVCTPERTPPRPGASAFEQWRFGDTIPHALFAQFAPVGNGSPAQCDGTTIVCTNGLAAINPSGTPTVANLTVTGLGTTAGAGVCTTAASQLTTSGCTSGGDTITSPNSSLTVGGTAGATTLDLNLAHTNEWSAQIHYAGAGGANACSGSKYPTTIYGACFGANNGTTNVGAIAIGPVATDFACTASCTAGDSARIRFYTSLTTGALFACDVFDNSSVGGLNVGCPLYISGRVMTQANATGGTCTPAAATFCTITLGHTYGVPTCTTGINTSTAANVVAVGWSISGTTLTLTTAAAGSTPLTGWCWGNGS
jgi:hypothetical protein